MGKVINNHKVAKRFELAIGENSFTLERKQQAIAEEAALDGMCIIRTSLDEQRMDGAERSQAALKKVKRRTLDDGSPVHSFSTLMDEMATIARNTCRSTGGNVDAPTFEIVTTANAKQRRALEFIEQIRL